MLNAQPVRPGAAHVLPRRHVESIFDLRDAEILETFELIRTIGPALLEVFSASGLTIRQNNGAASGQTEPHLHFHVIPRRDGDPERMVRGRTLTAAEREGQVRRLLLWLSARGTTETSA